MIADCLRMQSGRIAIQYCEIESLQETTKVEDVVVKQSPRLLFIESHVPDQDFLDE